MPNASGSLPIDVVLDRLQGDEALVIVADELGQHSADVGSIERRPLLVHQRLDIGKVLTPIEHELQHGEIFGT
jgi:hypothetical protein